MQNTGDVILPQLSASGQYLTDSDGNLVILRGFNVCSKTSDSPEQLGFDSRNVDFLRDHGVSVVRLGVPWTNTQPELVYGDDGSLQYNTTFLDSIKRTIQLLAQAGIYTLVDFHQDGYAVPWGFGAPSWAVAPPASTTNTYGWMVNTFGGKTFELENNEGQPQQTTIETDLNAAFDAFWNNDEVPNGIINRSTGQVFRFWEVYGAMLQYIAGYLSDQRWNILGYDPINEPEPGSLWTEGYVAPSDQKANPPNYLNFRKGYSTFDATLGRFYRECAIPSLQLGHPGAMIWFEPNIYYDYNAPTSLPNLADLGNVGFNFHNYDNTGPKDLQFLEPILHALDYQESYNVPLLCSEFGGTPDIAQIRTVAEHNDEYRLSAIFWAWFNNAQYPFYENVSAAAMGIVQDMSKDLVPPNLNEPMLAAVTRVYPRIIAGKPAFFYTSETGEFSFHYSTQLPDGHIATGDTVIVVPQGVYPNGFDVSVVPDGAATHTQTDSIVTITANPSSAPVHLTVGIFPRMGG